MLTLPEYYYLIRYTSRVITIIFSIFSDILIKGDGVSMTESQEQTIFSLFVISKSPLFIGASAVHLSGHSLATLLNKEVIAVHQDTLGQRGRRTDRELQCGEIWSVLNADGGAAVVLVNRADDVCVLSVSLTQDAGLNDEKSSGYKVRDLWTHEDLKPSVKGEDMYGKFSVNVSSCVMLRFSPI